LILIEFLVFNCIIGRLQYPLQRQVAPVHRIDPGRGSCRRILRLGHRVALHKNPVTDSGEKKSARGRIVIRQNDGGLRMIDGLTVAQQSEHDGENLLKLVWKDGKFVRRNTLEEIRARVR
jgi:hypothetical protein